MKNKFLLSALILLISLITNNFAQTRWGIGVSGGKIYLIEDNNINTDFSSEYGFEGELEFFIFRPMSFFVNSGIYNYINTEEIYGRSFTYRMKIIPYVNGLRLYLGNIYFSFSPGFLKLENKVFIDEEEINSLKQYLIGRIIP